MKEKIPAKNIFVSDNDWNIGRFHFPFADYEDPQNSPFGVLQALNDFELKPGTGFETHPHDEMEIISYCVEGTLEHVDSTGQKNTICRGDVQYLCAGSGVAHSERNAMKDGSLRFLQIWITPNINGLSPDYRSMDFSKTNPKNKLQLVVSGDELDPAIRIQQDANIFIAELDKNNQLPIVNHEMRQSYLYCLEGSLADNGVGLTDCDALKIWGKEELTFTALAKSRILMIEMAIENKNLVR